MEIIRGQGGTVMADKKITEKTRLITDPKFSFSAREAFNTLRTNILYALSPVQGKIVAVTSSNMSEGKSTISVNLAITMAQTSAKVLLIDADLRKPTVHKKLKLHNSSGLSKFIVGFESLSDSLKRDVLPNLDVMTSGPIPPNPSELLGSQNMQVFLNKINDYYDYIVIDTPPVNVVTDMAVLAKYVSGVLIVAKYGSSTIDDVRKTCESLKMVNANVLGMVVSNIDAKKYTYGTTYKKRYYYYQSDEK